MTFRAVDRPGFVGPSSADGHLVVGKVSFWGKHRLRSRSLAVLGGSRRKRGCRLPQEPRVLGDGSVLLALALSASVWTHSSCSHTCPALFARPVLKGSSTAGLRSMCQLPVDKYLGLLFN